MKKLFFLAAGFFFLTSGADCAELVAPVYPGAVEAPHEVPDLWGKWEKVFYSKDSLDKVQKYYDKKLGRMKEIKEDRQYSFIVKKIDLGFHETHQRSELGVKIRTDKPDPEKLKPVETDENYGRNSTSPHYGHAYFKPLEILSAKLPDKSWEDYDAVCERFGHLTWSFFMPSEKTDTRGKTLNMAEFLIAKHDEENPGMESTAQSAQEMGKKIIELYQQGRMSEAAELAKQQQQLANRAANPEPESWDKYIQVLEEIEKHAYPVRILIHVNHSGPVE